MENNTVNDINVDISKYCEIKPFFFDNEQKNFNIDHDLFSNTIEYRSDCIRLLLLNNYGGCWFDLDCFFLRSFDSIFSNYEDEICVYQWEKQNYPNNAIMISLEPESSKMKENIEFIINRNKGFGFQQASLTYNLPLHFLVLPCSWFDGSWIKNPYHLGFSNFFKHTKKQYDFNNFFTRAFCYHWHNRWNITIEENSIIEQLVSIIKTNHEVSMV